MVKLIKFKNFPLNRYSFICLIKICDGFYIIIIIIIIIAIAKLKKNKLLIKPVICFL